MMPEEPKIYTYPNTYAITTQMEKLLRSFSDHEAYKIVRWVSYDGGSGSIKVRMSLGRGGNRLSLIAQEMKELWDIMGRISEPEEWHKNLQLITCPRLRSWAAMVIWWDRHEVAQTEQVIQGWKEFISLHERPPYRSNADEAIHAAKDFINDQEAELIKKENGIRRGTMPNKTREDVISKLVYNAEERKLKWALDQVGFIKGKN